VRVEIVGTT